MADGFFRKRSVIALLLLGTLIAGACEKLAPPPVPRGNRVEAERLAQITTGVQTRGDVLALLGPPTARGTFDEENWYYISGNTQLMPGRYLELRDRVVVAISFDRRGVVQDIRQLKPEDGQDVGMVSRETPVPGTERNMLQALFGNIGRPSLSDTATSTMNNPARMNR
ncbi:MAG: outer membrane protein assembly factor BamE [Roseomonas sp.]|nr:outer membrane protein assembly factor BamE [Roseomonas sp.]MCA3328063.1 outer membrane protein assembly factor BamE [Roseomonas sp.]MCA3332844.1 outer membrane protein assembly factor BamE [Roseomonas sp.]MCA3336640.1 outer membrane protein assembly factor BamE [Roseomonas sp.]MCA3347085.1 outer membrane protein assembly factor BamE [Roseomonas sp.]